MFVFLYSCCSKNVFHRGCSSSITHVVLKTMTFPITLEKY